MAAFLMALRCYPVSPKWLRRLRWAGPPKMGGGFSTPLITSCCRPFFFRVQRLPESAGSRKAFRARWHFSRFEKALLFPMFWRFSKNPTNRSFGQSAFQDWNFLHQVAGLLHQLIDHSLGRLSGLAGTFRGLQKHVVIPNVWAIFQ